MDVMRHTPFKIESRPGKQAGQRILHVSGRLVVDTMQTFTNLVVLENAPILILDLSDLIDVDSTGIAVLVRALASTKLQKRRLALVGISEKVRRPLEITQVLGLFTVFETLREAEEALVEKSDES